jgi:hypothetical protein
LSFVRTSTAQQCISANELESELVARMGYNPFVGPPRQWIEAAVAERDGYFEVQLFERDQAGHTLGTRELREKGPDCHKLDEAIVLAIALIIDPNVQLSPASRTPPSPPTLSSAVASGPDSQAAPTPSLAPVRAHQGASRDSVRDVQREPTHKRLVAEASVDAVMVSGVMPGVAPGAQLVTQVPVSDPWAFRFSALYVPEKRDNDTQASLSYGLTFLDAGVCHSTAWQRLSVFGCLTVGAGAVHTVVHNPDPLQPGDRFWSAARAEVGASVRIVGPVWFEARLFDLVAFKRWQFRVRVDGQPQPAYEQKFLMPGAAVGLALHFD